MKMLLLFSMPGGGEWVILLLALLLFFGGKKIPELMRGVGKGIREFNSARASIKEEIEAGIKEEDQKKISE